MAQFETPDEAVDVLARSYGETDLEHIEEYFLEEYNRDVDEVGTLYADSDVLVKLVVEHMILRFN